MVGSAYEASRAGTGSRAATARGDGAGTAARAAARGQAARKGGHVREITVRYRTGRTTESSHTTETRVLTVTDDNRVVDDIVQYVEREQLLYIWGDDDPERVLIVPRDSLVDIEITRVDE